MRTLEKNKSNLWYVYKTGEHDEVDDNGHYTGVSIKTFSTPTKVEINIYPSGSTIVEQTFGKDASLDMVAVSNDLEFEIDGLLFESEPLVTDDYTQTYTYSIDRLAKSLNTITYGLKRRT